MKRVKTVSLIVASILLLNTFSACSNKNEPESSEMTDDIYTSYTADQTYEQTESTTAPNDELKWHTETITVKDSEGYIIDKTVTISDWISYNNNKDVLDQAWSEVGGGEDLTSPGGLGFNNDASYSWFDEEPLLDWNEVYYAVGTLELQNKTEGFDLSNYTMVMGLGSNSFEPTSRPPLKLKMFFSEPSYAKCLYNGLFYSEKLSTAPAALMKSNTWKVSFILAYAVNKTPNHPQGNPPADEVGITLSGLVMGYGMYENKVEIILDAYGESSSSSVTDWTNANENQSVDSEDGFQELCNMLKSAVDGDLDTAKAIIQKLSKEDLGNGSVPDYYTGSENYTEKVSRISYNCKDIGAFVFDTVDVDYAASNKRVVSVTLSLNNIERDNAQMGYEYFASHLSSSCGQPISSYANEEDDTVCYYGTYKTNDGYSFWVCYADWGNGQYAYYITCYNINDGYHTDSFIE